MTAAANMLMDRRTEGWCPEAAERLRGTLTGVNRGTVVIDFAQVPRVSTAVLAELVVLRRKLLADGCDLRVANMTGQVESLYRLCRLDRALPAA